MCGNAYKKAANVHNTLQQNVCRELLIQGQGHESKVSVQA